MMKVLILILIFIIALPGFSEQKILDMHCHTAGIGAKGSGCFISKRMRESYKFGIYLKAFGVTEQELLEQGDALVLQRLHEKILASKYVGSAIILALDWVLDSLGRPDSHLTEMHVPNAFLAKETAKYDNLYWAGSVNPFRKDALARLDSVKAWGGKMIKWIPPIMNFDPADSAIIPFYQKLAELKLPLLTHAGNEYSFKRADHKLGDPLRLELALQQGVTVIAAHAAATGKSGDMANTHRLMEMMKRYPNLYTDISALSQFNRLGWLRTIIADTTLHARILFGTDYPLTETPLVWPWSFLFRIPFGAIREISAMENAWDRDVRLKMEVGVPESVFTQTRRFFGI